MACGDSVASTASTLQIAGSGSHTFNGVIQDGAGNVGIHLESGSLTLTGDNTYSGSTGIDSGASLYLTGSGSIANSIVGASGLFDISGTDEGASIKSLSGTGAVDLGAEFLTLTDAHDTYSGAIGGTGGLTFSGGSEVLTGASTYTGATTVTGAALELDGSVTSAVTLGSGGILSGTGTIGTSAASPADGSLDAQAGSIIRPGGHGGADIGSDGVTLSALGTVSDASA